MAAMTLNQQKQFELLLVFNIFAAGYIFLHKTFVPSVVFLFHASSAKIYTYHFGFWWVYHLLICILMIREKEKAAAKINLLTTAGMLFLVGFLGLELIFGSLLEKLAWKDISNTLSYGTSFMISFFVWSFYRKLNKEN